jgi:hypothetical protein
MIAARVPVAFTTCRFFAMGTTKIVYALARFGRATAKTVSSSSLVSFSIKGPGSGSV